MTDCTKIRKISINQIQPNGEVLNSTIYFNIETFEQVSANSVRKCNNIEPINFTCATVCTPEEDFSCWLTESEVCWVTESGDYWELG